MRLFVYARRAHGIPHTYLVSSRHISNSILELRLWRRSLWRVHGQIPRTLYFSPSQINGIMYFRLLSHLVSRDYSARTGARCWIGSKINKLQRWNFNCRSAWRVQIFDCESVCWNLRPRDASRATAIAPVWREMRCRCWWRREGSFFASAESVTPARRRSICALIH